MLNVAHARNAIRAVRDRWNRQYEGYGDDHQLAFGDSVGEIRAKLRALDLETCSLADIEAAIGTDGWADNKCQNCGAQSAKLIGFTEGNEDWHAHFLCCENCLTGALGLLKSMPVIP